MSLEAIHAAIPHRKPFLFVDEIVARDDRRIVCRKTFTADEFFYSGHYPQFPLTPGVLLCEAAMQAGAILLSQFVPAESRGVPVATRMNDVRFKRMVRPGETIQMEAELTERLANAFFLKAKVTCDGALAVRFDFACTMAGETEPQEGSTAKGGRGSRRADDRERKDPWEGEAPAEPGVEPRPLASHPLPRRSTPAHGVLATADSPTIVFLTVCAEDRRPWLATSEVHNLLRSVWMAAEAWFVGRYVIMPDHLHLFAAPGRLAVDLDNWVRYWKSQFTKQHPHPAGRWQANHWDTRLRSWQSYSEKWEYVRNNPVRKGLVSQPDDWPFQGELYELRW